MNFSGSMYDVFLSMMGIMLLMSMSILGLIKLEEQKSVPMVGGYLKITGTEHLSMSNPQEFMTLKITDQHGNELWGPGFLGTASVSYLTTFDRSLLVHIVGEEDSELTFQLILTSANHFDLKSKSIFTLLRGTTDAQVVFANVKTPTDYKEVVLGKSNGFATPPVLISTLLQ